jgi:ribulose-bisphosphate carboxylase large chain
MAHPGGPAAGVTALHQAWQGAVQGLTVDQTASKYPEFALSVEKFGKK